MEAALVLPAVVLALLLVLQVGVTVRDQVLVVHGAREGARIASVDHDASAAIEAVARSTGLAPARLSIDVDGDLDAGRHVTVTVRYRSPVVVPLLRATVDAVPVSASVTIRVE